MIALADAAASLGLDFAMVSGWAFAGLVAGLVMIGGRPLGLFGDLILGVLAGTASGWAAARFGLEPWPSRILAMLGAALTLLALRFAARAAGLFRRGGS